MRLLIDAGDSVVMAGLVDTHVHVDDPGRTEWEGFETAGRAAAAGGTTTIVDMPLNCSPVTTTVGALEAKLAAADGTCRVDFGLWGGIVPGNLDDLPGLLDAGVLGFKAFLVPSGIDEFPPVDDEALGAEAVDVAPAEGDVGEQVDGDPAEHRRRYLDRERLVDVAEGLLEAEGQ